ncbi:MAG TPA: thioesterase family protein [Phenylobacterium sp.]|nr:thioesterase family protein [Phenylobacterium sp.]
MSLKELRRADYGWGIEIATRWADCDAYGHVNNIIYYSWFDTAVTRMMYERGALSMHSPAIGLCVESRCEYFAPVEFPQTIEARVRIGRMGEKSLRYEVGVFLPGTEAPAAAGHFVHVFVDRQTRRPTPLTDAQKAALTSLAAEVSQTR